MLKAAEYLWSVHNILDRFVRNWLRTFVLAPCKTVIVIGASGKFREHEWTICTFQRFKAAGYNGILFLFM
jgi:hypothetical protein